MMVTRYELMVMVVGIYFVHATSCEFYGKVKYAIMPTATSQNSF